MPGYRRVAVATVLLAVFVQVSQTLSAELPSQFSEVKLSDSIRFVKAIGDIPPQHASTVTSLAFSDDGRLALSGGAFPQLAIWDVNTGTQMRHWRAIDDHASAVGFALDDKVVVVAGRHRIRFRDVASGELVKTITTKPLVVASCAVSHDGRYVFAGGTDGSAGLWNLTTGKRIWSETLFTERTSRGQRARIHQVAFSSDDRSVAALCGKKLIVWQLDSRRTMKTLTAKGNGGIFLAVSSDGNQALSMLKAGKDLTLWDMTKKNSSHKLTPLPGGRLRSATFSADGKNVIGWASNTLTVWDADSGDIVKTFPAGELGAPVWRVAVSPDSRTALVGTADSGSDAMWLQLFDLATGQNRWEFPDHMRRMTTFETSSDGSRFFCCSSERGVQVWAETGMIKSFKPTRTGSVDSISLSHDDRQAIIGTTMETILYDVESGKVLRKLSMRRATGEFLNGGKLGLITKDGRTMNVLKVMDAKTGLKVDEVIDTGEHARFSTVSRGGRLAASLSYQTATKECELKVWDVESKTVRKRTTITGEIPQAVAFSADESLFLFGLRNGRVSVLDIDNDRPVAQIELCEKRVRTIRVSDDNRMLLAVCGKNVILWNLEDRHEVGRIRFPLAVAPKGIRFLPGKNSFLVGTPFSTLLIFEFSNV